MWIYHSLLLYLICLQQYVTYLYAIVVFKWNPGAQLNFENYLVAQPGLTHPLPQYVSNKGRTDLGPAGGGACASVGTPKIDAHTPFSEEAMS